MRKTAIDRFLSKVAPPNERGCELWEAGTLWEKGQRTYGVFWDGKKCTRAHVWIYEQRHGPIPPGFQVNHTCDTPLCMSDAHHYVGTHLQNMADRSSRGRTASGTLHPRSKITEEQVREIRALYASGGYTHRKLGRCFGLDHSTVGDILRGEHWASVR